MDIANLKISGRKIGRAAIGIAAMCALQAMAQQQVPAQTQKMYTPAWSAQIIPGGESKPEMVPAIKPKGEKQMIPSGFDDCGLSEVSAVELQAVRASILAALGSNSAGVASFTTAEKQIPVACTRKRAAYYLRAIAQIQSAK